ncbi:Aste57867_1425 [Aphanomyces stellatus]|uniref:Aste57867_1425 protein n=1 Tax=Aphanomyces stellatus TaxID=120398 RepID=A0A485KAA1_9STRA|nr:hypothetical protein As57867_001424 [Aphanomyces stellatus]VFT78642.1 Aste57867_1425 [Aphanomyces stellatus]
MSRSQGQDHPHCAMSKSFSDDLSIYCYICHSSTSSPPQTPTELLAPCACSSYVHRTCLDTWRIASASQLAKSHCPTCKSAYEIEPHGAMRALRRSLDGTQRVFAQIGSGVAMGVLILASPLIGTMAAASAVVHVQEFFTGPSKSHPTSHRQEELPRVRNLRPLGLARSKSSHVAMYTLCH